MPNGPWSHPAPALPPLRDERDKLGGHVRSPARGRLGRGHVRGDQAAWLVSLLLGRWSGRLQASSTLVADLARAAGPLSGDFRTQTSRLVARRIGVAAIQIAGLLPLIQLIARP